MWRQKTKAKKNQEKYSYSTPLSHTHTHTYTHTHPILQSSLVASSPRPNLTSLTIPQYHIRKVYPPPSLPIYHNMGFSQFCSFFFFFFNDSPLGFLPGAALRGAIRSGPQHLVRSWSPRKGTLLFVLAPLLSQVPAHQHLLGSFFLRKILLPISIKKTPNLNSLSASDLKTFSSPLLNLTRLWW